MNFLIFVSKGKIVFFRVFFRFAATCLLFFRSAFFFKTELCKARKNNTFFLFLILSSRQRAEKKVLARARAVTFFSGRAGRASRADQAGEQVGRVGRGECGGAGGAGPPFRIEFFELNSIKFQMF